MTASLLTTAEQQTLTLAAFGNVAVEASFSQSGANFLDGNGPFQPAHSGNVLYFSAYLRGHSGSGAGNIRAALYADNGSGTAPGNLIAVSEQVPTIANQAANWIDFALGAAVVASTNYWLIFWYADSTIDVADAGSGGDEHYAAMTYSSSGNPSNWGSLSDNTSISNYSIYAIYVSAGGATDTFAFASGGVSTLTFTPAGMADGFSFATTGKAAAAFSMQGADLIVFATAGKSAASFVPAAMSDAVSLAATGKSAPTFVLSGMADHAVVAVSGKSVPAFLLSGMADTVSFVTNGASAAAFALSGMSDPFALNTVGHSAPSFGVSKTGGVVAPSGDFPYAAAALLGG